MSKSQVYAVEYGAYSDRYISAVFTTRELAETYIIETARRERTASFVERGDRSFDAWQKANDPGSWGVVGYIEEYVLWDVVPIVGLVADAHPDEEAKP